MKKIICRVRQSKSNQQKQITIPKDCDIKVDDYVEVIKVK